MILTYKLKHNRNFSEELKKAKKIADFAIRTKSNTSKDVRYIGLKSAIANQILRKYHRREIRKATSVKLTIPGQSVKFDADSKTAVIPCMNLDLDCKFLPYFQKIRQIEIDLKFAHLSVEIPEPPIANATRFIGIDCNTTGHAAVVAVPHRQNPQAWQIGAAHSHKIQGHQIKTAKAGQIPAPKTNQIQRIKNYSKSEPPHLKETGTDCHI